MIRVVAAWLVIAAGGGEWPTAGTVTAVAGEPQVLTTLFAPAFVYANREEYEEQTQWDPPEVRVDEWPESLDSETRIGLVRMGSQRRTYILTGAPYGLIVDLDGDGSLADEERIPLLPETLNDLELLTVTITGDLKGPTKLGFPVVDGKPTGQVFHFFLTFRRGELQVGDRAIAFALLGSHGTYDAPHDHVFFDLDGDGEIAFEGEYSSERYRVEDKRVNLGDVSYAFNVDPIGDTLTLTPLGRWMPERAALTIGTRAPAFRFVDADLAPGSLEEYRGRVVLLYFWFTGCVPCQQLMPQLAELHASLHLAGFEILAINTADTAVAVREYVTAHGFPGRPVPEGAEGEIATLYRVHGVPTWFLIDREGKIAGHRTRPEELIRHVQGLFATDPAPAQPTSTP